MGPWSIVLKLLNVVGAVLMLVLWIAADKLAGKVDGVHIFCGIVFVIDLLCITVPAAWFQRSPS